MKELLSKVLLLLLLALFIYLFAYNRKAPNSLQLVGSTSVHPIVEILGEEFSRKNQGVRINVQGGGSSAGIKATISETADIGMSSRKLKTEEKGLYETLIAKDGIVVIIHPTNPIEDLTLEDLKKIFAKDIRNWNELGGCDAMITLISREASSGTRTAFEEIVMSGVDISIEAIIQNSTGAIKQTVAGDPNAIGYISYYSLDKRVKALKIENVEPSIKTISSDSYMLYRPFILLTKDAPKGLAKDFIEFVLSPEGQRICEREGLVGVK